MIEWLFGKTALAVADPTLINAVEDLGTAASENVTGILGSSVITTVGLFLAIVIGVGLVFKFLKRGAR